MFAVNEPDVIFWSVFLLSIIGLFWLRYRKEVDMEKVAKIGCGIFVAAGLLMIGLMGLGLLWIGLREVLERV